MQKTNQNKRIKKILQLFLALVLCAQMILAQTIPVQATEKATLKTVTGVKLKKGKGISKEKSGWWTLPAVSIKSYSMYLKSTEAGKRYLVSTKDGKTYKQTDLRKVLQTVGKFSSSKAKQAEFNSLSVAGNEVVVNISYYKNKTYLYQLRTTNGTKFTFHKVPSAGDNMPEYSEMWKAGSNYVLIRSFVEMADKIEKGDENQAFGEFKYYISTDKKTWEPRYLKLEGVETADGMEYKDAINKKNKYLYLSSVKTEGDYLYFGILYNPESEPGQYEQSEFYTYRTKDFETYEKVAMTEKEWNKNTVTEQNVSFAKNGIQYGNFTEWGLDTNIWQNDLKTYTLNRSDSLEGEFKEIFAYQPEKYSSKTLTYLYNWRSTGEQVSLFFEREKDGSLFVSKTGDLDFEEYTTSIKASQCNGVWEDAKNGYKIIGYEGLKYLIFSKDGFVNSYKIKLPAGTQNVLIKGSVLSVTAEKGNYYISLKDLYKKMK